MEGVRFENGLLVLAEGHPVEGCGALRLTAAKLLSWKILYTVFFFKERTEQSW